MKERRLREAAEPHLDEQQEHPPVNDWELELELLFFI